MTASDGFRPLCQRPLSANSYVRCVRRIGGRDEVHAIRRTNIGAVPPPADGQLKWKFGLPNNPSRPMMMR